MMSEQWELTLPLLSFSESDVWTLKDACSGTGIWGVNGSGKTSGSGQAIARAFLNNGFGGLVLCAKMGEAQQWLTWAKAEGREKSIIHIHPDKNMMFDFLDYEMTRRGGGQTENILDIFMQVIAITQKSDLSQGENAYFFQACKQLLRNAIDLCRMAYGRVSLIDVYNIVASSPTSPEDLKSEEWKTKSECFSALATCNELERQKQESGEPYQVNHELDLCASYFLREYPRFGDRLRSSISSIFTASSDPWLRGRLRRLFSRKQDEIDPITGKQGFYLDPDHCKEGAIYLFDYPVKDGLVGRVAQSLYKLMWQQHMERRNIEEDGGRPVFLWADEAQHFLLPDQDAIFAQTARSSRILTVLLSQNISNFYNALGQGEQGVNQTESLVGNLGTLIFHANTHEKTNRWASGIFGTQWRHSASITTGDSSNLSTAENGGSTSTGTSASTSLSEQQRNVIEPRDFTLLATGGEVNHFQVEAIINQAGRIWNATNSNYIRVAFDQIYP